MRKLKIYLDTSIISFVYADDAPEKQSITVEFFSEYVNKYDVSISSLVVAEIESTKDLELRRKLLDVIEEYDIKVLTIKVEDEDIVYSLARKYIKEKVIPSGKFEDALHIAICVYYRFDILLSWNFRHLANIKKQIQVNSINIKAGYSKELFLFNPMEVIYEK